MPVRDRRAFQCSFSIEQALGACSSNKGIAPVSRVLIAALLASTSTVGLAALTPAHATANCVGATTVTCSGNLSGGVSSGGDFSDSTTEILNVSGLTSDLTVGAASDAIVYQGTGVAFTVNVDTGTFSIIATDGSGIVAEHSNNANVTVSTSGTISTSASALIGRTIGTAGTAGTDGARGPDQAGYVSGDPSQGGPGTDGGLGNAAGSIGITNFATINTSALLASGIVAQSIGGVGGNGGTGGTGGDGLPNPGPGAPGVKGLGGDGGAGGLSGSSGPITIDNTGAITTLGNSANGISAETRGGDGGTGGSGGIGSLVGIGSQRSGIPGLGGAGGNSSTIAINNGGDIATSGTSSNGISVVSIAGNAGAAGLPLVGAGTIQAEDSRSVEGGGNVLSIAIDNSGSISLGNTGSAGIRVEARAGKGASGDPAGTGQIIGTAGSGGTVANVEIANSGILRSSNANSEGIVVAIEGGAGGFGAASANDDGQSGGAGGIGGDTGSLTIENSNLIETQGTASHGIRAKLTGGLGGDGGDAATGRVGGGTGFYYNDGSGSPGGTGGLGGSGGAAGSLIVDNQGNVVTTGATAHGVYAVNQGGSGGAGGTGGDGGVGAPVLSAPNTIGGDGGDGGGGGQGGNTGTTNIANAGSISVSGADAHGVYAVARGGDGGSGGASGIGGLGANAQPDGNVGTVSLDGASGIAGQVTVTNADTGTIQGGLGLGVGVKIETTGTGVFDNVGGVSALSGNAIDISAGTAVVNNSGTVTGNTTLLGQVAATFNNLVGGLFASGPTVDLGGGTLNNSGRVSPGGTGTVRTTNVTGGFTQTATGQLVVDADWENNTSDQVRVSGAANLNGTVVVNPISFPDLTDENNEGLTNQWTVLTATGGVTDDGLTATDTAAVDYSLLYPDANTVDVKAVIDLTPAGLDSSGLNTNQSSVGQSLNNLVGGGNLLGFVPDLLAIEAVSDLGSALNQLTPTGDGGSNASALGTGATFAGHLLSCRITGEGDANAIIREGQCLWARGNVRRLTNDGGNSGVGYDEDSYFVSGGAQFDIGGPWRIGFGLGYEDLKLVTDSRAETEGERAHFGGVLKYNPGPLLLAASITGGFGSFDNTRYVSFGTFGSTATSDYDSAFVTGRLTAAYQLNVGRGVYLKPQINGAVTHLSRDGYTETGLGGIALRVEDSDDTVFTVSPSVEVGSEVRMARGVARPYLRGGLTWRSEDTFQTTAGLLRHLLALRHSQSHLGSTKPLPMLRLASTLSHLRTASCAWNTAGSSVRKPSSTQDRSRFHCRSNGGRMVFSVSHVNGSNGSDRYMSPRWRGLSAARRAVHLRDCKARHAVYIRFAPHPRPTIS
ncbi:MAG: autotransporter domain-containing protein [Pseudomonadota bacterium]